MDINELKEKKKKLGYSNEKIAELSGVPLSTVQKIFAGVTQQPRYDTLAALESVLDVTRIGETVFRYGVFKKQGEYTVKDYDMLPDEMRGELIDGVLYDMTSPLVIHQELTMIFCQKLKEYIRKNNGECIALIAPLDIHLRKDDDRTIVQPDVFVVCDRSKFTRKRIEGAPDLIIEVLSPSTKKKDMTIKLQKYIEAGVREYWLADPESRKVIVYHLDGDMIPTIYTFDNKIPVDIFDGKCIIDMKEISEELDFFYQL